MRLKKFSQCLVMMTACLLVAVPGHAGMISTAEMVSDVSGLEFGNIAAQRDWIPPPRRTPHPPLPVLPTRLLFSDRAQPAPSTRR